ncbi:MAG TPA: hypothetical protein VF807_02695, partial [Ktedonobacterales bacterium]
MPTSGPVGQGHSGSRWSAPQLPGYIPSSGPSTTTAWPFGAVPTPADPLSGGVALGQGALLKGGRYRVERPYYSSVQESPQEDPPLLVAVDAEALDAEVLIQELPITSGLRGDANVARELIAQRLLALNNVQGFARLVDHFPDYGRQFLVFELPAGETLATQVARSKVPMPERVAITVALQLLDIVSAFENEYPPVIHGNINPAAIILQPSGQVALIGISPTLLVYQDGIVPGGAAAGVLGYAAPEQLRGQASGRSDIFAVCSVLYMMVTGADPRTIMTTAYRPAHNLRPDLSVEMDEIMGRGLRPAQAQRYESAAALRDRLRPMLAAGRRTRTFADDPDIMTTLRHDERGKLILPPVGLAQSPFVLLLGVLLIIALAGAPVMLMVIPQPSPTPAGVLNQRDAAAALFQSRGIGLSTGTEIFDSQRADNREKQAGAQATASGDLRGALQHFTLAQAIDRADPEAAIYAANAQVAVSGEPVVTIVAAVAYGTDTTASG